jgi:hypothetical protein
MIKKDNQMINKNKHCAVYKYILILLSIIVSSDSLIFGANMNQMVHYSRFLLYFAVSMAIIVLYRIKVKLNGILLSLIMICIIIISSLCNKDFSGGYFAIITIYMYSMIIVSFIKFNEFVGIYQDIIYYIALISLFYYFISIVLPQINSYMPIITNKSGNKFYSIIISNSPMYYGIFRNWSLFREPGVYQMYLNISLMFMFFYKNNKIEFIRLMVIIMAIFSTFSTTGYIVMCMLVLLYIFHHKTNSKGKMLVFITISIFIFITTCYFLNINIMEAFYYRNLVKLTSINKSERLMSIILNIYIGNENILFGAGINNTLRIFGEYAKYIYNFYTIDNTNHLLIKYSNFGIIYFSISMFLYYGFIKMFNKSFIISTLLYIILIMMFMGEECTFSPFFNIIMFYGINSYSRTHVSKIGK